MCPHDVDVAVVGSGFGGSVAALRLAEKGYSVTVLEKGKRWRPEDFPETNWNLPKSFWLPWLGCHGTWALRLLRDVLVLHGVGVGGGSLVYANTHREPRGTVWDDPQWRDLLDWRSEMKEPYARARRMLGTTPNPVLGPGDEALRRAAERRGRAHTFRPTDVGIFFGDPDVEVPDPYFGGAGPPRIGCDFRGACMTGCRKGAKNTLDKNYLYLAERLGARVVPETRVTLLERMAGGGWALHHRSSTGGGARGVLRARKVVLAGGVLGTVPLLLDSARKTGLTLPPAIGTLTRTNSEALLGLTSRGRRDLWQGIAITSSAEMDEETSMEPVRFTKGADVMLLLGTLLTDGGRGSRPLRFLKNALRHPGELARVARPWGKAERSQVLLVMQTRESAMRLVKRRRWWWPFSPVLGSQAPPGARRIPSYIPIANQVAREMASDLDAIPQSALNEVLLDVPTTAHILGGCAIGATPETGVVDASGRVFGHEDLWVMDGSVIGANLGVNPALTITALAELAASRIAPRG